MSDENENEDVPGADTAHPAYYLEPLDFLGFAFRFTALVFGEVAQLSHAVANEFVAAANLRRRRKAEAEKQVDFAHGAMRDIDKITGGWKS